MDFNSASWGRAATGFLRSIKENLASDWKGDKKFEAIINDANKYLRRTQPTSGNSGTDPSVMLIDETDDKHAFLCNNDSD